MRGKKVSIKNPKKKSKTAEKWVESRGGVKRLTIDFPAELHTRLKIHSAKTGQTMGEIVRDCLEEKLDKME